MVDLGSLPIDVWHCIAFYLDARDIRPLLCCSRVVNVLLSEVMAQKPLVWKSPRTTAFNLHFWDKHPELVRKVKILSVSVTAQVSPGWRQCHSEPMATSQLVNIHGLGQGTGCANAEQHALVIVPSSVATTSLFSKMIKIMRSFTMLQSLTLHNMRLPADISLLIHAFPHLRNLELTSCAMSNYPAGLLYKAPGLLERLSLVDIRYPPTVTEDATQARELLTKRQLDFVSPLILLAKAPNLRSLSLDSMTATLLTIFSTLPLSDTLQELRIKDLNDGDDGSRPRSWPLQFKSWSPLTLLQLLMIYPTVRRLAVYGSWTQLEEIPDSLVASFPNLITLEGSPEGVGDVLERWRSRFFREILISGPTGERQMRDCINRISVYRLEVLDSLRLTQVPSWDHELLVEILKMSSSRLQKLEIAYDDGFPSETDLTTLGQSLLEKFPCLCDLRIYNSKDGCIPWLILLVKPAAQSSKKRKRRHGRKRVDPPSPAINKEKIKYLLGVWHGKSPVLNTVQVAAKSVWRLTNGGDVNRHWLEEHI